jgi:hypothetical protein
MDIDTGRSPDGSGSRPSDEAAISVASSPEASIPNAKQKTTPNVEPRKGRAAGRRLTLYRDDSTAQVRYERVKSYFFTANNTVLTISRYDNNEGEAHHYIHWPRERFCWFKDEPQ